MNTSFFARNATYVRKERTNACGEDGLRSYLSIDNTMWVFFSIHGTWYKCVVVGYQRHI